MTYQFDVKIAEKYGLDEAIMLNYFVFWINKNIANKTNFYDDNYWTYCSTKAFTEIFSFWSEKQIRRILKSLEDQGIIITGNYNKSKYDRTKWYAINPIFFKELEINLEKKGDKRVNSILPNGQMEKPKRANLYQINKTDNIYIGGNKHPSTKPKGFQYPKEFEEVWAILRTGDKWRGFKAYANRRKQGYTQEEIMRVVLAESKKTFAQRHFSTTLNGEIDEIQEPSNKPKTEIINGRKVEVDEDGGFWE